ncbi:MAG: hypothetical protein ABW321_29255 [Polyangiales bacterium]
MTNSARQLRKLGRIMPLLAALTVGHGACGDDSSPSQPRSRGETNDASVNACQPDLDALRVYVSTEAHQVCTSDTDCRVVALDCIDLDIAYCGQVAMNTAAETSAEWRAINESARCSHGSDNSSCLTCAALLVASCDDGRCYPNDQSRTGGTEDGL